MVSFETCVFYKLSNISSAYKLIEIFFGGLNTFLCDCSGRQLQQGVQR